MIEHPAITAAEQWGYPTRLRENAIVCERCGDTIQIGEQIFTFDGMEMCSGCVKECIEDAYNLTEIAKALKISLRYAADLEVF